MSPSVIETARNNVLTLFLVYIYLLFKIYTKKKIRRRIKECENRTRREVDTVIVGSMTAEQDPELSRPKNVQVVGFE